MYLDPFTIVLIATSLLGGYVFLAAAPLLYWYALASFVLLNLLTAFYVAADYFTGEGITEAVFFHLTTDLTGVDPVLLIKGALAGGGVMVLLFIFVRASHRKVMERRGRSTTLKCRRVLESIAVTALAALATTVHPAIMDARAMWPEHSIWIEEIIALGEVPLAGKLPPSGQKRKNLLFIYAESLERTFLDHRLFPGLASNLIELEESSLSFRGVGQAPLTSWTIAGMAASQCGMPLSILGSAGSPEDDGAVLRSGRTCVGDILHQSGYRSIYVGGADLRFAGKERFYRSHGFDEIYGLQYFETLARGEATTSDWGIYDDELLGFAYDKLKQLASQDQPFALFMLTLDTHPPHGHVTPACSDVRYESNALPMLNAVKCSDRLLAEFVRRIEASEFADDLLIVIASDHLQLPSDATPILQSAEAGRENLFLVRGREIPPRVVHRNSTTLDIGPTVLSLMGFEFKALGLGRSLVSDEQQTLVEKYGRTDFYDQLRRWRLNKVRTRVIEGREAVQLGAGH